MSIFLEKCEHLKSLQIESLRHVDETNNMDHLDLDFSKFVSLGGGSVGVIEMREATFTTRNPPS